MQLVTYEFGEDSMDEVRTDTLETEPVVTQVSDDELGDYALMIDIDISPDD
jgi:hypothetical protein